MSDDPVITQPPAAQDTEGHLVHVTIKTPEGAPDEAQGTEGHTIEVIFNTPEGAPEAEDTEGQMMTVRLTKPEGARDPVQDTEGHWYSVRIHTPEGAPDAQEDMVGRVFLVKVHKPEGEDTEGQSVRLYIHTLEGAPDAEEVEGQLFAKEMRITARPFVVSVRFRAGGAIVDLHGEINATSEGALTAAYAEASSRSPATILLNFTDVTFMDATGLALIVGLLAQARKVRRRLLVYGLSEHYVHIFQFTRLADFMPVFPNEMSALAGMQAPEAKPTT